MAKQNQFIRIELAGHDPNLWENLQKKFMQAVNNLLDATINIDTGATVKEEMQNLIASAIDFSKQKLAKPGFDNAKVLAEIDNLYSQSRKTNAEARSIEIENQKKEFDLSLNRLKAILQVMQVFPLDGDEKTLVFIKNAERLIETIRGLEEENSEG